jgi:hypothetical protein
MAAMPRKTAIKISNPAALAITALPTQDVSPTSWPWRCGVWVIGCEVLERAPRGQKTKSYICNSQILHKAILWDKAI